MSSIIDALKKSDKNRSQAGTGSVNQIKFESQANNSSRRGFYLLIAVLLVVAGGALAWQQGWLAAAKNKWFDSTEAAPATSTQVTENNQPQAVKNDQQKTRVVNKLTPPKPDVIRQKSNRIDQKKANDKQPAVATQQPETTLTQPQKQAEITELTPTEDTIKPVAADVISENNQHQAQSKANARQETDKTATSRNELAAAEQSQKQQHLLLHQLDFEIRKSIPPVKLNIHIYDPEPENRMVIINGVKFITGDVIEEAITVQEINQQGVVLEFGGTTFLIPK